MVHREDSPTLGGGVVKDIRCSWLRMSHLDMGQKPFLKAHSNMVFYFFIISMALLFQESLLWTSYLIVHSRNFPKGS